tara:strand:- start:3557 stop:4285 length:729 start_codon:yes stop_codon:yes gene_type:complete
MSKKPPSLVEFNFSEDIPMNPTLSESVEVADSNAMTTSAGGFDPVTGEENPNFIYEEAVAEAPIEDEEPLIRIEEKEQINRTELFDVPADDKPVKVKKPRKPMSEAHKAKLAIAREKAMASRKIKAEERKKMKALDNEEKELVKQQKVKRVKKLKEEVNDERPLEVTTPTKTTGITKKDLEDAQLDAIMKYEAIRKQRKEEKKQAKIIEEGKQKMLNQINRATGGATNYRYRDGSNRFDGCY